MAGDTPFPLTPDNSSMRIDPSPKGVSVLLTGFYNRLALLDAQDLVAYKGKLQEIQATIQYQLSEMARRKLTDNQGSPG
jgi:hypothetical protein